MPKHKYAILSSGRHKLNGWLLTEEKIYEQKTRTAVSEPTANQIERKRK